MMSKFRIPLGVFIYLIVSASSALKKGDIHVVIKDCKSDNGRILVALYNSSDTYLTEAQALTKQEVTIVNNQATIHFEDLPFGTYAFAFFHDENRNYKLDKNLVGIPKEGFGFSNNARGYFGPPSFEKSRFTLNSLKYTTEVELYYLLR